MYPVDSRDRVNPIDGVPQSSVGAPCPMVVAGEHHLCLAFILYEPPTDWDGGSVRAVDEQSPRESIALVKFDRALAHILGPPNDEAFTGHPLAARGLQPYGVFEVLEGSWIRALQAMNSVHPYYRPEHFEGYRHFVFSFHDTTFECVAEGFSLAVHRGSVVEILRQSLDV